jgi:hypothetical protein
MHQVVKDCEVGASYCPDRFWESEGWLDRCGAAYGKVNECLDASYFAGVAGKGVINVIAARDPPARYTHTCEVYTKRVVKNGTAVRSGKIGQTGEIFPWEAADKKPDDKVRAVRCW